MTEFQSDILLLISLISGLMMTGVIWMVQIVQYPLFLKLSPTELNSYHLHYTRNITFVVLPLMFLEILSSIVMAFYTPTNLTIFVFALVLATWLSTFFLSVPLHQKLSHLSNSDLTGPEIKETCHKLVVTNWPRTILWSLKSIILIIFSYPFPI